MLGAARICEAGHERKDSYIEGESQQSTWFSPSPLLRAWLCKQRMRISKVGKSAIRGEIIEGIQFQNILELQHTQSVKISLSSSDISS